MAPLYPPLVRGEVKKSFVPSLTKGRAREGCKVFR